MKMDKDVLTKEDIYNVIGNRRDKIRAYFGISVDILEIKSDIITIKVKQEELKNNFILTQSELVSRAGKLFENFVGYKLHFIPVVFSFQTNNIDLEWIQSKMKELGIKRNDIIKQLAIDKIDLSNIFSGKTELSKRTKAMFFYYLLTFELNRDLRDKK